MDNHHSHVFYEALSLAKENFVHIITLPPHTSNKTQPLDRTVFGPMKTHYNQLANSWMMRNVGKLITIYQIAELAGTALTKAATPENVIAGFRVSGVLFSFIHYAKHSGHRHGQKSSGEGNPSRSDWHRNDAPHQERHCFQRGIWKLEIVLVLYARITSSTHYLNCRTKH